MNNRLQLPARRRCETFELPFGGLTSPHVVTVGFYDDGRLGEVFITGGKSGEMVEAIARDGAVMTSLALQHGVTLDTMRHAITCNSQEEPQSIVGAVVERLGEFQQIAPRHRDGSAIDRRMLPKTEENKTWDADAESPSEPAEVEAQS
jgi:hypothetical protein